MVLPVQQHVPLRRPAGQAPRKGPRRHQAGRRLQQLWWRLGARHLAGRRQLREQVAGAATARAAAVAAAAVAAAPQVSAPALVAPSDGAGSSAVAE